MEQALSPSFAQLAQSKICPLEKGDLEEDPHFHIEREEKTVDPWKMKKREEDAEEKEKQREEWKERQCSSQFN